ncbi:hypothetical protein [Desulfamplus magnetovallimortis]|uniref:hypothetical protein n=1 Tax=Desulfamplus magnetovallimortis TaxID=1246637 RepID=UPI001118BE6F|nr:hypothetical protein [Desulfamplus magnetovallimortis]
MNGLSESNRAYAIDSVQQREQSDPQVYVEFFKILILDPAPIGSLWSEKNYPYLWFKPNYFQGKAYPDCFVSEIDTVAADSEKAMENHNQWVKYVHENYSEKYVQEHLSDDLPNFLQDYQDLLCSRGFSYADVWELKQIHLNALYEATVNGQWPFKRRKNTLCDEKRRKVVEDSLQW